ncbi:MAG TPA: AEC family transporter, partial [Burkholderiaceae bacterium]|nr:AEC family transporter [Burkholderiaceae bacterium]
MGIFVEVIFPVVVLIAIGYGAARLGRFSDAGIRALSDATFLIFMPALLFGALARVDFDELSPGAALAYYGASLPLFVGVIAVLRWRGMPLNFAVIRGLCAVFSNTAMLGIPLIRLVYGEAGLAYLLTIIALHALTYLTLATLAIEIGGGVAAAGAPVSLGRQLARVVRSSLIHPVVLPILVGLAWSAAGWPLPPALAAPLGML